MRTSYLFRSSKKEKVEHLYHLVFEYQKSLISQEHISFAALFQDPQIFVLLDEISQQTMPRLTSIKVLCYVMEDVANFLESQQRAAQLLQ